MIWYPMDLIWYVKASLKYKDMAGVFVSLRRALLHLLAYAHGWSIVSSSLDRSYTCWLTSWNLVSYGTAFCLGGFAPKSTFSAMMIATSYLGNLWKNNCKMEIRKFYRRSVFWMQHVKAACCSFGSWRFFCIEKICSEYLRLLLLVWWRFCRQNSASFKACCCRSPCNPKGYEPIFDAVQATLQKAKC